MSKIVEQAKTWVGTPFRHQGRDKFIGADCAGLILGVGQEVERMKLTEHEQKVLKRYRQFPSPMEVESLLAEFLDRVEEGDEQLGDIVLIKSRNSRAGHVGIITQFEPFLMIIHANDAFGKIVEQGIPPRSSNRVLGYFRYKG